MLNFDVLGKGLGIVSPPHFVYDFSRKMFLMLYSINRPNFIVLMPLLIGVLQLYVSQVRTSFKIHLIFLIKPFFYMTKKSRQKIKYHVNEKSF